MLIDCAQCPVRGRACQDCAVSALLGPPAEGGVEFDATEQVAFARLAQAGLLPPLATPGRRRVLRVVHPDSSGSIPESA